MHLTEEEIGMIREFALHVAGDGALQAGHAFVPELLAGANRVLAEIERRVWA
jgi:hypothetical protein